MANPSRAFQTIIPGGNPNGLKIITMPGWSGRCYVVPRQSIGELKLQEGNSKPGLYILFGQNETAGDRLAYIGESENFFARITSHDSNKDFWDTAVIFTGELNKAYVKYLEHRATLQASKALRMAMQNKIQPVENALSEFDKVAVEQYFEYVQFLLAALGYEIFENIDDSVADSVLYYLRGNGFDASAKLLNDGSVLVLKGSTASIRESGSFNGWAKSARSLYLSSSKLKQIDDLSYEFSKDILFKKPSPAAAVVAARSINGWTAWKDINGNTLDENVRK